MSYSEFKFRNTYEKAFGVRPAFSVAHLTDAEIVARTEQIKHAQKTKQLGGAS
jgi:hypothetical protein